eukprot:gene8273-8461_t
MGLEAIESRKKELHAKVKAKFLQSIDSFKSQVDDFCSEQVLGGSAESDATIAAMERLSKAQHLVEGLGIEARTKPLPMMSVE